MKRHLKELSQRLLQQDEEQTLVKSHSVGVVPTVSSCVDVSGWCYSPPCSTELTAKACTGGIDDILPTPRRNTAYQVAMALPTESHGSLASLMCSICGELFGLSRPPQPCTQCCLLACPRCLVSWTPPAPADVGVVGFRSSGLLKERTTRCLLCVNPFHALPVEVIHQVLERVSTRSLLLLDATCQLFRSPRYLERLGESLWGGGDRRSLVEHAALARLGRTPCPWWLSRGSHVGVTQQGVAEGVVEAAVDTIVEGSDELEGHLTEHALPLEELPIEEFPFDGSGDQDGDAPSQLSLHPHHHAGDEETVEAIGGLLSVEEVEADMELFSLQMNTTEQKVGTPEEGAEHTEDEEGEEDSAMLRLLRPPSFIARLLNKHRVEEPESAVTEAGTIVAGDSDTSDSAPQGEAGEQSDATEVGSEAVEAVEELPFELRGTGWRQHLAYHQENIPRCQFLTHLTRIRRGFNREVGGAPLRT